MDNEFLTSLQQEGRIDQPAEEQKEEKETPPESSTEKEPTENEPEPQTGDEPEGEGDEKKPEGEVKEGEEPAVFQAFHKHPRWKALNEELGTLRSFRDEVSPLLPLIKKLGEPGVIEDEEAPKWFSTLFGDNKQAWKEYQEYDLNQRKQLRTEILGEIQKTQESVAQSTKKQEEWLDSELTSLDEAIEEEKLPKYDRNELLKIAVEFKPTDEKGNISLRKAYEIWRLQKGEKKEPPKSDEKKEIADKTMGKPKGEKEAKNYRTSHDLANKSFHDLIPE